MPKQSARQKRKVKKVMHEYKHDDLKSGKGGKGGKVKSRRQAIAIAMSEADVPKKRGRKKKGGGAGRKKSANSGKSKSGSRTTKSKSSRKTAAGRRKRK